MQFTEEQAVEVKKWVVKRLEDISDADSDVLADYVLALIRSDAPDEEIRRVSIESLEDFLRDNTTKFVDEIFARYGTKIEPALPAAQQPQFQTIPSPLVPAAGQPPPLNSPLGPPQIPSYVPPIVGVLPSQGSHDNAQYSRKRAYNEGFQGDQDQSESQYGRSFKTPRTRRGGGRGDRMAGSGRDGIHPPGIPPSQFAQPLAGFQGIPHGFPTFDQNDPLSTMLALQSVTFPQIPGLPPLPIPTAGGGPVQLGQSDQSINTNQPCPVYETQGICYLGATCPYQHGRDHLIVPPADNEYDPTNATILIDVQKAAKDGTGLSRGSDRGDRGGRGRGKGDRGSLSLRGRGRAEFSHAGPNDDKSITTIVVENIPEEKFDEQTVRNFFSEFGTIVETTMQAYKHLALVKFDSYAAARRAYSSPKAVFDNRFVKVYWYKPTNTTETNGTQLSATPMDTQGGGTTFDKDDFGKQQAEAQRAHEERTRKRKETEDAKLALQKQRDQLMKRQQEEKVKLLQKLGKQAVSSGDQPNGHKDENPPSPVDDNVSDKTRSLRAQLAALEAEAKSLGIDPNNTEPGTSSLQRGRGRGWASYRGRGWHPPRGRGYDPSYRGGFAGRGALRGRGGVLRLDNRPKRVAISGVEFDSEKDEALRQYLIGIGEYESIELNPDRPDSQIVTFKDRYIAEKLMYGPSNIPSVGKIELSWATSYPASMSTTPGISLPVKKADDDTVMGNGGDSYPSDPVTAKDNNSHHLHNHEVDYDVAEVDDGWV